MITRTCWGVTIPTSACIITYDILNSTKHVGINVVKGNYFLPNDYRNNATLDIVVL